MDVLLNVKIGDWFMTEAGKLAQVIELYKRGPGPANYRLAHADRAYSFWHNAAGRVEYIDGLPGHDVVARA